MTNSSYGTVVQPSSTKVSWKQSFFQETGLKALHHASYDVYILTAQRFLRMIAYGQSTLILVLFFQSLDGISETKIGLFMSLTLVGDVLLSYFLTLYADCWGRRKVLFYSAVLMLFSGIIFSLSSSYYFLLIAAILGVISPSGDETGPFKSIEESTLAHITPVHYHAHIFAWYGLFGTMGGAVGSLSGGMIVDYMTEKYSKIEAYRFIFVLYSACAAIKLVLTLFLSQNCELDSFPSDSETDTDESLTERASLITRSVIDDTESDITSGQSISDDTPDQSKPDWIHYLFGAPLSKTSKPIVLKLLAFFAFDALGYGFLIQSWLVVYFTEKFNINAGPLGSLLFTTTIIGSLTSLLSAALYRRLGPIKAMVFTHLPSALFAAAIPAAGNNLSIAMVLLMCRAATTSMDVVPRTAFLSVVVKADERTRVMGMVNIVKTLARSVGPFIVGKLSENGFLWVSFIIGGALESAYDIGLFASFYWIDKKFKER